MSAQLILLLGGSGERFDKKVSKQFYSLPGDKLKEILTDKALAGLNPGQALPIFEITARQFVANLSINTVTLVVEEKGIDNTLFQEALSRLKETFTDIHWQSTAGGSTRHLSMRAGLNLAKNRNIEKVLIHDANRPYISLSFIKRIEGTLSKLCKEAPCFIPVLATIDSICRVEDEEIVNYENRNAIFRVQTPQLIFYPEFSDKIDHLEKVDFTDEGSMAKHLGLRVQIYEGDLENVKITFKEDLR